MKTKYKHIHFEPNGKFQNRERWTCCNNKSGGILADVFWYTPWRKFAVTFKEETVWDKSCLRDIADFLGQLKKSV